MIFGSVAVGDAIGGLLAHSVVVAGLRWSKGRRLSAADIAAATAAGLTQLTVARLGADDVEEATAAAALAAALAGDGVGNLSAAHGRANLAALNDGVFRVDAALVAAVNRADEGITLATLAPFARVTAGEIVATVKIIPYGVNGRRLAEAIAAIDAAALPLAVATFKPQRIALLQTRLPGVSAKAMARTATVTQARVAALGGTLVDGGSCAHTVEALSGALVALIRPAATLAGHPGPRLDIVLIAGASATADRRDVVPAAIVAAGGTVERLGMPVDPGNLLCLGSLDDRAVIGLPGCARSPKRNGFDWVLEQLVAGLAVTSAGIAAMGVGGLLPEAERPQPRAVAAPALGPAVPVVLAAGRSSRMGDANKLLADLGGQPLVTHIIEQLAAAGLPPPVVVLGSRADEVRAAIEEHAAHSGRLASDRDSVRFVVAADFADGLSASLRAGITALPPSCAAALVCLGDMPRVGARILRVLAAATSAAAGAEIIAVPIWAGKRGNPVLWGRAHFTALARLQGGVGGKALLSEHAHHVVEVAASDDGVLTDVDTPEALAALRAGLA